MTASVEAGSKHGTAADVRDDAPASRAAAVRHTIVNPPLTDSVCPVTNPASSDARNATAAATSSGRPIRPIGPRDQAVEHVQPGDCTSHPLRLTNQDRALVVGIAT